jgi:hypothetical protein
MSSSIVFFAASYAVYLSSRSLLRYSASFSFIYIGFNGFFASSTLLMGRIIPRNSISIILSLLISFLAFMPRTML